MTAAARQALRRSREARGLAVYGVEVGATVMNSLEIAGYLKEHQFNNREAIAEALGKALVEWAEAKFSSRVTQMGTGKP